MMIAIARWRNLARRHCTTLYASRKKVYAGNGIKKTNIKKLL